MRSSCASRATRGDAGPAPDAPVTPVPVALGQAPLGEPPNLSQFGACLSRGQTQGIAFARTREQECATNDTVSGRFVLAKTRRRSVCGHHIHGRHVPPCPRIRRINEADGLQDRSRPSSLPLDLAPGVSVGCSRRHEHGNAAVSARFAGTLWQGSWFAWYTPDGQRRLRFSLPVIGQTM
jgi:hypothetical protein